MTKKRIEKYTVHTLAGKLGIDHRTLRGWLGDMKPAGKSGRKDAYTLDQAGMAIKAHRNIRTKSPARERLLAAQAEKAEFQLGVLKEQYIRVDVVERQSALVAVNCKNVLMRLPSSLPEQLAGLSQIEIHSLLKSSIREALTYFSDHAFGNEKLACPKCAHEFYWHHGLQEESK